MDDALKERLSSELKDYTQNLAQTDLNGTTRAIVETCKSIATDRLREVYFDLLHGCIIAARGIYFFLCKLLCSPDAYSQKSR